MIRHSKHLEVKRPRTLAKAHLVQANVSPSSIKPEVEEEVPGEPLDSGLQAPALPAAVPPADQAAAVEAGFPPASAAADTEVYRPHPRRVEGN